MAELRRSHIKLCHFLPSTRLRQQSSIFKSITYNSIKDFNDKIEIQLISEDYVKEYNSNSIVLIIEECFMSKLNINMWISGQDSIKDYILLENSKWINSAKKVIKNGFGPNKLAHLIINLNTSGSILEFLITKEIIVKPVLHQ